MMSCQRIESAANEKSVYSIAADYDADGTTEVFAIIGSAEEILNEITAAGNTYTDIICRGNGMIHINYHSSEGFNENATLRLENGNVQLLAAYSGDPTENLLGATYGGLYVSAMIPEIATYP